MRIGFAGIGRMGRPMARHLAGAGYRVIAHDPEVAAASPPDDLTAAGVEVTDDVTALADTALTVSMLPDSAATERLLLGADGLLTRFHSPHVHVVMGTVGPASVRALAEKAHDFGIALADAPVSGSVSLAEAGTIITMVGADPEVFDTVRPVLAAMTRAQIHTGTVGTGSAAKLATNLVLASLNQALAEGLLVATADGIDPSVFYDVLESSAVAAPYVAYKREAFLRPATAGVAFPLSLLHKDVTLGTQLAHDHRLTLPVADTVAQLLEQARQSGYDGRDMAEVLALLAEHNQSDRSAAPSRPHDRPGKTAAAEIRELENRRYAAMLGPDLELLDELLSDEVIYTHSNAAIDSKHSYLDLLREGTLVYRRLEHTTDTVLTWPGTAIINGTMSGSIRMHGTEKTLNSRTTAVWVSEHGQWRLAAFQPTPIPRSEGRGHVVRHTSG